MKKTLVIITLLIMMLSFTGCGYNKIVSYEENVNAAFGNLQAAYQRRLDLIPNLVAVVKGYAKHEQETLTAVVEARAKATSVQLSPEMLNDPDAFKQFQSAQNGLGGALSRLMVVVEKYPDLKANQNFLDLQHQLEGTENRINVARVRYNEAVTEFNKIIKFFPTNITNAMFFKHEPKQVFQASEAAQEAPKVNFE